MSNAARRLAVAPPHHHGGARCPNGRRSRSQALARIGQYVGPPAAYGRESWLARLDRARHRIPFWWWLTYDALVGLVIVFGISASEPAYWLGLGVLAIAVVIDAVEFVVKRPRTSHGRSRRDGTRP